MRVVIYIFTGLSDCGPLSDPPNGVVDLPSGTIQGSSALYTCNTGFEFTLTSISFRVCLASSFWTGDEPTCESKLMIKCHLILTVLTSFYFVTTPFIVIVACLFLFF